MIRRSCIIMDIVMRYLLVGFAILNCMTTMLGCQGSTPVSTATFHRDGMDSKRQNAQQLKVRGFPIDVCSDGSLSSPLSQINIGINIPDPVVFNGDPLVVRIVCPTIGASRTEHEVVIRSTGDRMIKDCFGTDPSIFKPNTLGNHSILVEVLDSDRMVLATAILPMKVMRFSGH